MNKEQILLIISAVLIAIFGSAAKTVSKMDKKKITWQKFLREAFSSAFAGSIVGLICVGFNAPIAITLAISGVAGHYGAGTIDIIIDVIKSKLMA
jgi:hypothetical protein